MERVQYDEATKQQVLTRVAAGEPYRKVADEIGLPHGTVYSWVIRARRRKKAGGIRRIAFVKCMTDF